MQLVTGACHRHLVVFGQSTRMGSVMPSRRAAKIIATLGPASSSPRQIAALFNSGANVFRLNFSHGSHDDLKTLVGVIRDLERRSGRPIAILMDLQGPKIRIGTFASGSVNLKPGARFRLDRKPRPGDETRVTLPHAEVFSAIRKGNDLLLDDGRIRLRVETRGRDWAETRVITGGRLSDRKGVNVPDTILAMQAMTEKDQRDLAFALDVGADWIGLSFVQRPRDIEDVRAIVKGRAKVMAKLEKPAAIGSLEAIVDRADGVMVARGDLGVELPPEDVPSIQKRVIRCALDKGKPVVVATQMLESMIHAPSPTRAEASDVATAVYDGADAVMLSAETAVGSHGVAAVKMMDRIIRKVESDPHYRTLITANRPPAHGTDADAITAAAASIASTIAARAIVTFTTSGSTTLRAARQRPQAPILCLTANIATARRMCVAWGVRAVVTGDVKSFSEMVVRAGKIARREGLAKAGQKIVVTAGVPFGTPGATNVLRIHAVQAERRTNPAPEKPALSPDAP